MATLVEKYARQIKVAENYAAENFGVKISERTKHNTAVLIENTNKFMSMRESFATERADLGAYKKFCLNLTNIAVPTLIASDLVITQAMTSFSGGVAYLRYVSKTNKGDVKVNDEFNSVFGMGKSMDEARMNFTSELVNDTIVKAGSGLTSLTATPMKDQMFDRATKTFHTLRVKALDGTITYYDEVEDYVPAEGDKVSYRSEEFQMKHVPAQDIPTIGPVMDFIPLVAQPRRIRVVYDQISVFQAKQDYGFSLDKQIAEQAVGELNYEIDTEIVDMLYQTAVENTTETELDKLTFSKTLPHGVNMFEHFNSFLNTLSKARTVIYNRTQKFMPNYMVCAPDVLNVLEFVNGYKDTTPSKVYGPYKAGTLNGLNIYVSPKLPEGEYFVGLNGSDMMSSAGVYAPYMAIVPTALLNTPDGGIAQGFSTWYAKAIVNANLVVRGKIVA